MTFLQAMKKMNPKAVYPTGMAPCIVGISGAGRGARFVLSREKCIQHYMADGMDREEAEEFMEYNLVRALAYYGTDAPRMGR